MRLALNLVRRSREAVRDNFIIGMRISSDEHCKGGLSNRDAAKIAAILEGAGLDYIHLSSGTKEAWKYTYPDVDCAVLPEAETIKKAVSIPVICPGFHDPGTAAQALGAGKLDIISI